MMNTVNSTATQVKLDPTLKCPRVQTFELELSKKVIGQKRSISSLARVYQVYCANMNDRTRPIANMMLMGPTGVGKTKTVEAAAEVLFGKKNAVVKINCAEFQHSHEIAKLVGSPPGYLGHRETSPFLTQDRLEENFTTDNKLVFVLFDEIEKASDALWTIMLGIMDKGSLRLGTNQQVSFSNSIIVMTSNLGAKEMSNMINGHIGFAPTNQHNQYHDGSELDQKIYHTALAAAKRKFLPEFMNRLDKIVVCRSLHTDQLREILDLELMDIQEMIYDNSIIQISFECTNKCKEFLLSEGTDLQYGARMLRRTLDKYLIAPIAKLMDSHQVESEDHILIDKDPGDRRLIFQKIPKIHSTGCGTVIKKLLLKKQ